MYLINIYFYNVRNPVLQIVGWNPILNVKRCQFKYRSLISRFVGLDLVVNFCQDRMLQNSFTYWKTCFKRQFINKKKQSWIKINLIFFFTLKVAVEYFKLKKYFVHNYRFQFLKWSWNQVDKNSDPIFYPQYFRILRKMLSILWGRALSLKRISPRHWLLMAPSRLSLLMSKKKCIFWEFSS